jgi:ABC-type transporter Mla MlaB component
MVRGSMDTVEIEQSPDGTTLLMDRVLRRAPVVSPAVVAAGSGAPARAGAMTVAVTASDEPRIALGGPVDLSSAADLRRELWTASRGGALPLVVELGGVSHLTSAGIRVLDEFAEDMASDRARAAVRRAGRVPGAPRAGPERPAPDRGGHRVLTRVRVARPGCATVAHAGATRRHSARLPAAAGSPSWS